MTRARRPRREVAVSRAEKQMFLSLLCVSTRLLETFATKLKPERFPSSEASYRVLTEVLFALYHRQQPPQPPLHDELLTALQCRIDEHSQDQQRQFDPLINMLADATEEGYFSNDPNSIEMYNYGLQIGKKLLREHQAFYTASSVLDNGTIPANLPEVLSAQLEEAQAIEQLGAAGGGLMFPEGWDISEQRERTPTNLSFIDIFLRGGAMPGEVYTLMGPFGSCKTTTAIMLSVEAAFSAQARKRANPNQEGTGLSFYISYEAPQREIRLRSLAYGANVRMDSLEGMERQGLRYLSTPDNLRDYEREMFREQLEAGAAVSGERQRVARAIRRLNPHMIAVDLSGDQASGRPQGAGGGGVEEIVSIIEAELAARRDQRPYVCSVVVDYAKEMVDRYMSARSLATDQLRFLLGRVPGRLRHQVAARYGCHVFVLHQLSGEANSKSPGAKLSHTDASECRSFAENAHFAFLVGTPTADSLCQFACDKQRRNERQPPRIVRIEGAFNRVVDVTGHYYLDAANREIRPRTERGMAGVAVGDDEFGED